MIAALPLLLLFVMLGVLRVTAWVASLVSLALAIVLAILVYGMPLGQTLLAGTEGAAFGFFPILWIVINAIWVYQMTVETGHFDVLAALVRSGQRRPAGTGGHHRVLVRRTAGGAGRVRHTGRGDVGDADGARLPAAQGGGARADRQHRARRLRGDGHPDPDAGQGDRAAERHARRDGGPADADPRAIRAVGAGRDRRRVARSPGNLAGGAGLRRRLRDRAVRDLQLHLGAAGRRGRVAAVGGRGGRDGARLASAPRAGARGHRGRRCRRADSRFRAARRQPRRSRRGRARVRPVRDHHRGLRDLSDHRGQESARQGDLQVPLAGAAHRQSQGKAGVADRVHAEPADHAGHSDARRRACSR